MGAGLPELEVGTGTPREAVHLVEVSGGVRLVGQQSGTDYTDAMHSFARRRVEQLASENLSGYILKKDSPSCGLYRVRLHHGHGRVTRSGRALANVVGDALARRRLGRVSHIVQARPASALAAGVSAARPIGCRVEDPAVRRVAGTRQREFVGALANLATRAGHTNVLQHRIGYFRDRLEGASRRERLGCVEDYRRGLGPLIVPITLIAHYVRRVKVRYLEDQVYLGRRPKELALRNHV